jgi:hypothetical protein
MASVADADSALTLSGVGSAPECANVVGTPTAYAVFQDGQKLDGVTYSGTSDARIDGVTPTTNLGGDAVCAIKGGNQPRSCLLRWDLSSLPSTARILGACVELTIDDPSVRSFDAFELERAWSETDTTWNSASSESSWDRPGAQARTDRGRNVVAQIPQHSAGSITIPLAVPLVQKWVTTPAENNGVVFANAAAHDGIWLSSSESTLRSDRPALRVYLTP